MKSFSSGTFFRAAAESPLPAKLFEPRGPVPAPRFGKSIGKSTD